VLNKVKWPKFIKCSCGSQQSCKTTRYGCSSTSIHAQSYVLVKEWQECAAMN